MYTCPPLTAGEESTIFPVECFQICTPVEALTA